MRKIWNWGAFAGMIIALPLFGYDVWLRLDHQESVLAIVAFLNLILDQLLNALEAA